jgi:hypothetical protein
LLVFVEDLLTAPGGPQALPQRFVPTMQTVIEVQPTEISEADLRSCIQVCVKTCLEGCIIVICLLSTLVLPKADIQPKTRKYDILNSHYSWILNCLARLWKIITPVKWHSADSRLEQCVVLLLETLASILDDVAKFKYETFLASKTLALLNQVICTVVSPSLGQLTLALERALCSALVELARAAGNSKLMLFDAQENILPLLKETKEDHSYWNAFSVDLQVCSSWPANVR